MKFAIFIALFLFACGEIKDDAGIQEDKEQSSPSATQQSPEEEGESTNTTCLYDCNPLESARLDFGSETILAIQDCEVKDFEVIPTDSDLQVLMLANCLEGTQVYSAQFDFDGKILSLPSMISIPCYQNFKEVKSFAVSKSAGKPVAVYACPVNTKESALWFYVDSLGSKKIETFTTYSGSDDTSLLLSWNPASRTFAAASKRGLIRISEEGSALGGRVNLNLSRPIQQLTIAGDSWIVLSRDPYSSRSYCSKVLSNGQLACDKKEVGGLSLRVMDDKRILQSTQNYPKVSWQLTSFQAETCSTGPAQFIGDDNINSYDLRQTQYLKDNLWFALGFAEDSYGQSLMIHVFENQLAGKMHAGLPITNGPIQKASAIRALSSLYVFYTDSTGQIRMKKAAI